MSLALDSDLLRTFLAVVDAGNVTRAADIVGRTQSAVSMQIKKLEDMLGDALFERHSRGVVLTPQGMRLLDNARRIVTLLTNPQAKPRRTRPPRCSAGGVATSTTRAPGSRS